MTCTTLNIYTDSKRKHDAATSKRSAALKHYAFRVKDETLAERLRRAEFSFTTSALCGAASAGGCLAYCIDQPGRG